MQRILICTVVVLFCSNVFAHHIISGYVIDANTSEPLIGATILIDSSTYGTTTNEVGYFEIGVDEASVVLLISFMGYESKLITVNQHDTRLTVVLNRSSIDLNQIQVSAGGINSLNNLSKIDLSIRPIKSSQDVLQIIPGLFIAQHAGGGKAEQIFLRGFDTDHGTDIAITADGIPGNMVSHAHGQGYADMHFVIPELINMAEFGKGPYYSHKGNFNTAGYINLKTYNTINRNTVKMEGGDFNSFRSLAILNLLGNNATSQGHNAYMAAEYSATDGPFEEAQNFNRINLFTKYSGYFNEKNFLRIQFSHLQSKWDASGQVPDRAVNSGEISRFGSIDPTEGGNTSRTNASITVLSNISKGLVTENQLYCSHYMFDLFSNFTFYLHDSINGDQIRQKEQRSIYGLNGRIKKEHYFDLFSVTNTLGYGFRYDDIDDSELSNTSNRVIHFNYQSLGDIDETNVWLYADSKVKLDRLLINMGVRADGIQFDYYNKLDSVYRTQSYSVFRLSPKLNFVYNANSMYSLFLKTGVGFHSNDTRVVVENNGSDILPAAFGIDLGANLKPVSNTILNLTLWHLRMQQEFVYVGDEAVVEPSGKTQRLGVDFSLRASFRNWLYADFDLTYAHGNFIDEPEGENYIPLAPQLASTGGLTFKTDLGVNGSVRYRYIKDRPANEDNSIVALGYFVVDAGINYMLKNIEFFVSLENIFNSEWNEAQFATLSRLQNESYPVDELHYTPGTPFFVKGGVAINF